jgi:hypothetical protein
MMTTELTPRVLGSKGQSGAMSEARCACPPLECNAGLKCPDNCAAMAARREMLAADNRVNVDAVALAMALNVLRRAGKLEVAAALQDSAKRSA